MWAEMESEKLQVKYFQKIKNLLIFHSIRPLGQHCFIIVAFLLAQINCSAHAGLVLPSSVGANDNLVAHKSNSFSNKTLSFANSWPPNLQNIDIWKAEEVPNVAVAEQDQGVEGLLPDEMLLLQANEDFQFAGNNLDVSYAKKWQMHDSTTGNERINSKDKPKHGAIKKVLEKHLENHKLLDINKNNERQKRVIHLFPVPVDGECLSDDGRRTGTCFNIYECRAKGGLAKGDCAMGFGVCCIFIAECNTTISNNITYLVSPQFPSYMPSNFSTPCNFKIKLMDNEVSQLRLDFHHFSMGQPNRRNGVCDGDVFAVSGGPSGTLSLCGQNSGQHIYYEIGGSAAPRQTLYGNLRPLTFSQLFPNTSGSSMPVIEISMNFSQRFQPIRLWEIRIAQIPFSQRAPVGCLQYYTGTEGIIQTFNFAENGRHLANQNYRICMRQEQNMCSIMYQPCDEQSFRIGPSRSSEPGVLNMGAPIMMMDPMLAGTMAGMMGVMNDDGGGAGGVGDAGAGADNGNGNNPTMDTMSTMQSPAQADAAPTTTAMMSSSTVSTDAATTATTAGTMATSTTAAVDSSTATMSTQAASSSAAPTSSSETSTAAPTASETPAASSEAPASSSSATTVAIRSSTTPTTPTSSSTQSDDITDEGSGGGDTDAVGVGGAPNRRPRPVSGGFDLFGFLRSAFDFTGRQRSDEDMSSKSEATKWKTSRQLYSRCNDRITMPCIVEDFIGMSPLGSPTLPRCEPVHCGSRFCSSGVWPCRIESTVTPFYIGVHFGSGIGKGSAEDNIGACLRFQQVECM